MLRLFTCSTLAVTILLCSCTQVAERESVARIQCGPSTTRVEIPRDTAGLRCLSRKFTQEDGSEIEIDIPVPIQSRRQNYSTVCAVPLQPIGDAGPCVKTEILRDLKLKLRYDSVYKHYHLTLTRPDHTKVLDAVEPELSRSGPVSYLEYTDKVNRHTYYVYLVDPDPASTLHAKYYWVEVFDDNNQNQACNLERPPEALKIKEKCDPPPNLFTRQVGPGFRQTDTGGGYEPPP